MADRVREQGRRARNTMNSDYPEHVEFERLLKQVADGDLSPVDTARLGELLESSAALRQHYLDYCQIHAMLRCEHGLLTAWSATDNSESELQPSRFRRPGLQVMLSLA